MLQTTTVTGMDAVYYLTKDLERARKFYESALGLRAAWEGSGAGGTFVEYELPDGSTFGLGHFADSPWNPSGGVLFAVDDVQSALERVRVAGAIVDVDVMESLVCDMTWLRDTEGNSFCLHHRK